MLLGNQRFRPLLEHDFAADQGADVVTHGRVAAIVRRYFLDTGRRQRDKHSV